jgi:hypothetical protein
VLLTVIFSCKNAPDNQTGFEPGISQNNSAVFSRISAILGGGNPSWEDSLRRRIGTGKRVGSLPVLWGILDPGKQSYVCWKKQQAKMLTRIPLRSFRIFYEPAQQS